MARGIQAAVRCKSKKGGNISPDEMNLLMAAIKHDKNRYIEMNKRVLEATKPPGCERVFWDGKDVT